MIIRRALLTDMNDMAKVRVDTWRTTYRGLVPDDHLDNLSYEKSTQRMIQTFNSKDLNIKMYVAENDNGEIVGFANGGMNRDMKSEYKGEIFAIYILKDYQGNGIGKKLIKSFVNEYLSEGINSMIIWVLKDNDSIHFYEALGGKRVDEKVINIGGNDLNAVGYGWKNIRNIILWKYVL